MYFQYDWNKLRVFKQKHNRIIAGKNLRKQRGTALVFVTLTLITIFSFAALAIDVGYLFVVRNELQNAADSAALAGARRLFPLSGTQPNWSAAQTEANTAITLNKVDATLLTDGEVNYGYWDLARDTDSWRGTTTSPNATELPAVKVKISKSNGQNGGGITTFFAGIMGINTLEASATAVAVAESSPSCIDKGALMPFAMNKCAYDQYWDANAHPPTPMIVPLGTTMLPGYPMLKTNGTILTNGPTEVAGQPYLFWLTSEYRANNTSSPSNCETGQWTTLDIGTPSANDITNIIKNIGQTNGDRLCANGGGANGKVFIAPGAKDTDYRNPSQPSIKNCASLAPGTAGSCAYAMISVINQTPINENAWADIYAFACVHVTNATNPNGPVPPYIEMQMVASNDPIYGTYCISPNAGGNGINYGATQPPVLVNYSGNTY